VARHGLVEARHFSQAVVERYPRQMWMELRSMA